MRILSSDKLYRVNARRRRRRQFTDRTRVGNRWHELWHVTVLCHVSNVSRRKCKRVYRLLGGRMTIKYRDTWSTYSFHAPRSHHDPFRWSREEESSFFGHETPITRNKTTITRLSIKLNHLGSNIWGCIQYRCYCCVQWINRLHIIWLLAASPPLRDISLLCSYLPTLATPRPPRFFQTLSKNFLPLNERSRIPYASSTCVNTLLALVEKRWCVSTMGTSGAAARTLTSVRPNFNRWTHEIRASCSSHARMPVSS